MFRNGALSVQLAVALDDEPVSLADVGARGGLQPHWRRLASLLNVTAFEPDGTAADKLVQSFGAEVRQVTVVPAAVWDQSGRKTLHVTRSGGASSLYEINDDVTSRFPEHERLDVVRRVEVDCSRIDDVLPAGGVGQPDFIKIDCQGGALPVLQGAEKTLLQVSGLEVELGFLSIYRGESLFGEVDAWLSARGFDLIDLRPIYWRREDARYVAGCKGQLSYCDALYMVRPEVLFERVSSLPDKERRRAISVAIACCSIYNLYDRVVSYASGSDDPLIKRLGAIAAHPTLVGRIPDWRRRHWLAYILKKTSDALGSGRRTWAPKGTTLGN